jgi:hypothetical protein
MAIYDQKCKLSKRTNRQISLALFSHKCVEMFQNVSKCKNNLCENKLYRPDQLTPAVVEAFFFHPATLFSFFLLKRARIVVTF